MKENSENSEEKIRECYWEEVGLVERFKGHSAEVKV